MTEKSRSQTPASFYHIVTPGGSISNESLFQGGQACAGMTFSTWGKLTPE